MCFWTTICSRISVSHHSSFSLEHNSDGQALAVADSWCSPNERQPVTREFALVYRELGWQSLGGWTEERFRMRSNAPQSFATLSSTNEKVVHWTDRCGRRPCRKMWQLSKRSALPRLRRGEPERKFKEALSRATTAASTDALECTCTVRGGLNSHMHNSRTWFRQKYVATSDW